MRKFIVSDLHGNGNVYDSIMGFLDNINRDDDVILYINGDLIDRGNESFLMFMDVCSRIVNERGFKIEYLAGNHELMMYNTLLKMRNNKWPRLSSWFLNGGRVTALDMDKYLNYEEKKRIISFISNLNVYNKFSDSLDNKNIVLVHAMCPRVVNDSCDIKLRDINLFNDSLLWGRKDDSGFFRMRSFGNSDYFTIIGHTPVRSRYGYEYNSSDNILNIDGGSAAYVMGYEEYDHVPLVEIDSDNNRLNIFTFDNNNNIIAGNYFINGISVPMEIKTIDMYRDYLKDDVLVKKRVLK